MISLKHEEFEALLKRAPALDDAPRLLSAEHHARWEDGRLAGTSTFTVVRDPRGPVEVPLVPWNLATGAAGEGSPLGADPDGRVMLRVPPEGLPEISVAWRHPARPSSDGRDFALDLPRVPIGSLELDLPDRFVPEGFDPAVNRGPAGRRLWRRAAGSGSLVVRLRDRSDGDGSGRERPWVSGPSTVDVGPTSATWRAEWTVETNGPGRSIRVGFGPGLEPTDASGPSVESTELRRVDGRAEMTIRLRGDVGVSTPVLLRGIAAVPFEKPWPVPSARPIDGEWLGGNVMVRLDRSRVLGDCRVLQGRRLAVTAEMAVEKPTLVFEPALPGPVAELTFVGEGPIRGAEVHGSVRYGPASSTLEARLRWSFPRGRPGELAIEWPDGWSIERINSGAGALDWHREPIGGGLSRVEIAAPPIDPEATALTVRILASSPASGDGPRALPRIRPVGLLGDEVWLASAPANRLLIPQSASGVAWLDPIQAGPVEDEPATIARALAWRWCAADASAVAAIVPAPREVVSRIEGAAEVDSGRIRFDFRLSIRPGPRTLSTIPIGWSDASGGDIAWRVRGGPAPDRMLTPRALSPDERVARRPGRIGVGRRVGTARAIGDRDRPRRDRGPRLVRPRADPFAGAPGRVPRRGERGAPRRSRRHRPGRRARAQGRRGRGRSPLDGPAPPRPRAHLSRRRRPSRPGDHAEPRAGAPWRRVVPARHRPRRGRAVASPPCPPLPCAAPARPRTDDAARHATSPARSSSRWLEILNGGTGLGSLENLGGRPSGRQEIASKPRPPGEAGSFDQVRGLGPAALADFDGTTRLRIPIPGDAGPSLEIVLEYDETEPKPSRVLPTVPALTIPCLDFLWTIITPSGREIVEASPGLVAVDPSATEGVMESLVGPMKTSAATSPPTAPVDAIRDGLSGSKEIPSARSATSCSRWRIGAAP